MYIANTLHVNDLVSDTNTESRMHVLTKQYTPCRYYLCRWCRFRQEQLELDLVPCVLK
jgi:hypothetical protein